MGSEGFTFGGWINNPAPLFDRAEVIGEGKQARLDIAIDETAQKTAPVAALRPRRPEQMPGQTDMEEVT